MFIKSIVLLTSIFLFTSCGNILVRTNLEDQIKISPFEKPKTLTVRHGAKIVENRYKRDYGFGFESSEYEAQDIEKAFKDSEVFKLRRVIDLYRVDFKKDDAEAAKVFLEKGSFDPESDFQLNIYTPRRYGHSLIMYPYMVWIAGSIVTLGLLPVWMPRELVYFGDIRSSTGKVIYEFNKTCNANAWIWSPLLLAGHWDKPYIALEAFKKDCILSIISDAQKAKVF